MADITLTWVPAVPSVGQELFYAIQGTTAGNAPGNGWTAYTGNPLSGTTNTVDLIGLQDNEIFVFAIRNDCGNNSVSTFLTGTFDTTPTPCVPPASVNAVVNGTNLDVTWTTIPGELYTVTESTTSFSAVNTLPPVHIPIIAGQMYHLTVAHNCSNGLTGTVTITNTVGNSGCLPVTSVIVSPIGTNTATVSWTSTGPATYTIYNGTTIIGTTTTNSINLTGLTPGTIYNFTIVKTCSVGNNSTPVPFTFTTICDPGTFAINQANSVSPCDVPQFTVRALGSANATKLEVHVTNLLAGESYDISTNGGSSYILTGLTNPYTIITGLTANTLYNITVRRHCQVSGTSTTTHTATTSSLVIPTITFEVGVTTKDETPALTISDPGTNVAVAHLVQTSTIYTLYANFETWRAMGSGAPYKNSCKEDFMTLPGFKTYSECSAVCGSQSTLGSISKGIKLRNVFVPDGINVAVVPYYSGQFANILTTLPDTGNYSTVRVFVDGWDGPGNIVDIKIGGASITPDLPSTVTGWSYPRASAFPIYPSQSMVAHTPNLSGAYVDVEIHTDAPLVNVYPVWDPVIIDTFGRKIPITSKTQVGSVYVNKFHNVVVAKSYGCIWITIRGIAHYHTV